MSEDDTIELLIDESETHYYVLKNSNLNLIELKIIEFGDKIQRVNDKLYFNNKIIHRNDGPAIIRSNGINEWYQNGLMHRDDGPAIEDRSGNEWWFKNGLKHRDDGPAVNYKNGNKEWYFNGLRHKDNGPAIIRPNGEKEWYVNGELHREDGPAIEDVFESENYWIRNKKVTKKQHEKYLIEKEYDELKSEIENQNITHSKKIKI